jgi:hypothetical protein
MQATKDQLIERIKNLMELPVYRSETRNEVLAACSNINEERLAAVAALLDVRYRWLQKLASDTNRFGEMKKTIVHLHELAEKYGLSS